MANGYTSRGGCGQGGWEAKGDGSFLWNVYRLEGLWATGKGTPAHTTLPCLPDEAQSLGSFRSPELWDAPNIAKPVPGWAAQGRSPSWAWLCDLVGFYQGSPEEVDFVGGRHGKA